MKSDITVVFTNDLEDLQNRFLQEFSFVSKILLVADQNTYRVAGHTLVQGLRSRGNDVRECVLNRSSALVPDERALGEILFAIAPETELIVAVGSGTINDLAKLVSYKTGKPFVILATAASMDGFASTVSAMTINGYKLTVPAAKPLAIMAAGEVLHNAPPVMTAAGLGDLLGKFTCLADWWMGHLICGEKYSEPIAQMVRTAVRKACETSGETALNLGYESSENLLKALILSGEAMRWWGDSRPASGAEHHLAHFWEMQAAMRGEPARLHGAKVGVATILISGLYQRLFQLDASEVEQMMKNRRPEMERDYRMRIEKAFGPTSGTVLEALGGYYRDETWRAARQEKILQNWDALRHWVEINIPDTEEIRKLLLHAGGPVAPEALGIDRELVRLSFQNAMEMRQRYTVFRLAEDIGFKPEASQ